MLACFPAALIAVAVCCLSAPSDAAAADAPPSVIQRAQQLHSLGDLGGVVRLLEADAALPAEAPLADQYERLRLLAWAAARLDRHDLAQRSFAAWIRASAQHRLDRAHTPAAVYADYVAALLSVAGPELDVAPRLDAHPQLPIPPPSASSWPKFAPPPRSPRDQARDFVFLLGPNGSLAMTGAAGDVADHLGAQLGVELEPLQRWRLGLQFHLLRWSVAGQPATRPGMQLRAAWALWPRGAHRLEVIGGGGAALSDRADMATAAALALGLRYHGHDAARAAGWFVELADQMTLSDPRHLVVLAVGVAFRPARAAPQSPAPSPTPP